MPSDSDRRMPDIDALDDLYQRSAQGKWESTAWDGPDEKESWVVNPLGITGDSLTTAGSGADAEWIAEMHNVWPAIRERLRLLADRPALEAKVAEALYGMGIKYGDGQPRAVDKQRARIALDAIFGEEE